MLTLVVSGIKKASTNQTGQVNQRFSCARHGSQDTAPEASPEYFCVSAPKDSCPGKGPDPVSGMRPLHACIGLMGLRHLDAVYLRSSLTSID
jgi:hypothetical protein